MARASKATKRKNVWEESWRGGEMSMKDSRVEGSEAVSGAALRSFSKAGGGGGAGSQLRCCVKSTNVEAASTPIFICFPLRIAKELGPRAKYNI